jgi:Cu(I)-responsive transcriptional regulator
MTGPLAIGDLARQTGTKVNTIRFYEETGLLPRALRTASGRRTYAQADISRLAFIRGARVLGFGLEQVRTLLELADDRARSCNEVDALARQHLADVEAKIASLKSLRQELSNLIGQCERGTIADCRIIEALGPQDQAG